MKTLTMTAILLALTSGFAVAEGDSGGLYIYETMQQVQSGNYAAQFGQNGEQSLPRR